MFRYELVDGINDIVRNVRLFLPILWGAYAIYADLPEGSESIIDLEAGEYKIPYTREEKENGSC